jgi:hypothetical protein
VILSSNDPADITDVHCYCGSAINKPLYGLCKPLSPKAFTHAVRLPKFPVENSLELAPSSTSLEPVPSSSPPRSLRTVIPNHSQAPLRAAIFPDMSQRRHRPRRHRPQAHDTVPKPTTTSSSPSPQHCAPDAIPEPAISLTHAIPWPTASSSPRRPRVCDAVKPTPSNPHRPPQARKATLYIFVCHCGPTNPDFHMLHYHIALICYIAFVLLHYFDVLHCHIALICYIAFNMSHCFDILYCHIALICYIAFDMLHCFNMLHYFCSVVLL